jgi:AraC family transcriptional regulator of adaptative response / DNA-3-methyladenine glycosylase II
MLGYFAARAIPGVEQVSEDVYRRTIVLDGDPGVLELFSGGSDHLLLRAHLPHWEGLVHVVGRARRIASLDFDLDEPTMQLADDAIIGPLLQGRPGLRPPGAWDPFETGVRAIAGQQVTVAAANTIVGRLVERHGSAVTGLQSLGLSCTFPPPDVLAAADLTGLGLTRSRAAAIRTFAAAIAAGTVRLDRSLSLDELIASLTALDGLGAWTAHYLALRLGEPDACPLTDLGLKRALAGHGYAAEEVSGVAERWRPWRALATTHLWLADSAQHAPASSSQTVRGAA